MAPTEPTVTTIVSTYLRLGGFDGLCREECGCGIEDLAPCDMGHSWRCTPAYKWTCSAECPERDTDRYGCLSDPVGDDHGCWRSTRQETP